MRRRQRRVAATAAPRPARSSRAGSARRSVAVRAPEMLLRRRHRRSRPRRATTATRPPATAARAPARSSPTTPARDAGPARVTSTIVCGDGIVEGNEACDDGDTTGANGCSADCTQVDVGLHLPGRPAARARWCRSRCAATRTSIPASSATTATPPTATAARRPASSSPATPARRPACKCTLIAFCGDGRSTSTSARPATTATRSRGDGCSSLCQIEPELRLPRRPASRASRRSCAATARSAAARPATTATPTADDGCSATCQVEAGWSCPTRGQRRASPRVRRRHHRRQRAVRPRRAMNGTERRLLGDVHASRPGWTCDAATSATRPRAATASSRAPSSATTATCIPYDGCSPTCTIEPKCAGGTCTAVCGDGLKFPERGVRRRQHHRRRRLLARRATIEPGFTCTATNQAPPATLVIPILYRDMLYNGTTVPGPATPTSRTSTAASQTGLVQVDARRRQRAGVGNEHRRNRVADRRDQLLLVVSRDRLQRRRLDEPVRQARLPRRRRQPDDADARPSIVDQRLPVQQPDVLPARRPGLERAGRRRRPTTTAATSATTTSRSRASCTIRSPTRRARRRRSTSPATTTSGCSSTATSPSTSAASTARPAAASRSTPAHATTLGLVDGGMYSIDMFQAERHTTRVDLQADAVGLRRTPSSTCAPICGDGIVEGNEVCDDGIERRQLRRLHAGLHGARAVLRRRDRHHRRPRPCDDGIEPRHLRRHAAAVRPGLRVRAVLRRRRRPATASSATTAPTNGAGYGHCTTACTLGPRCGDGIKNGPEQCDDGINNGASNDPCSANCTLKCGNGVVDPGEQCDDGTANNTGGYGKCNPTCTLGAPLRRRHQERHRAVRQRHQQRHATARATPTARSRRTAAMASPNGTEQCDNGAPNSATAYGAGQVHDGVHDRALLRRRHRRARVSASSARAARAAISCHFVIQ